MSTATKLSEFASDTLMGLTANQKFLHPKYFYDDNGSRIFQKIMRMPEYYPTDSELEIFSDQSSEISKAIAENNDFFDIIELGPGDGLKSGILLKNMVKINKDFTYIPVDISRQALRDLVKKLNAELPELAVHEAAGDYFHVMHNLRQGNGKPKVILFLGSNIGNFSENERKDFLQQLSEITAPGDKLLLGIDLKKSPGVIINAYNDPHGYTRDFNLNHLTRINREMDADFQIDEFEHHASYDPVSGAAKSYLVSKKPQKVNLGVTGTEILFRQWESIFMELSQKFDPDDIEKMAIDAGFVVKKNFTDRKNYFADSLWERK
ncbi:MAG: L-histidine N(alpha)-methyltransferase [Bacteroidales bacterium]